MDQDASNIDANDQTPSIANEKPGEQPEAATAKMDAVTTPEGEMDIDLPRLPNTEQEGNTPGSLMRMEVPDSEEASDFSSPVKIAREEKRNEAADLNGGAQMDRQASGHEVDQEDIPKAQDHMMRTEIPDSEEASKFSSPIKVAVVAATSRDETLQAAGGLETIGESLEEATEDGDATMIEVSAPGRDDEMAQGDVSRATDATEGREGEGSITRTAVDNTTEMEYTMEQNGGLLLSGQKAAELGQGILAEKPQDASTAATSPSLDDTKDLKQDTSSAEVNDRAESLLATPVKGGEGTMEFSPVNTDGPLPISSPALDPREIAIAARKLLADEVSPTVSDVTETTEQPKSLKGITAIPDSDDDEDDEPPDVPAMQNGDMQITPSNSYSAKDSMLLAATKPAAMEGVFEGHPTLGEVSKAATLKQRQRREVVTFPQSSSHGNSEKGNTTSHEVSSSPTKAAIAPPTKKNSGARSTAKDEFAEDKVAAEPTSSPPKSQEPTRSNVKILERPVASTKEESSQASDIPSSPLGPIKGGSFKTKRKESPSASFPAPEASQTKDVVMAELKAMKIASIQNRISALQTEIATKRSKLEEVTKNLKQPATETVKRHIKLLHDYNDIRDVGQGLVGMIADNRGVRIGELYEEFGVGLKD